MDIFLLKEKFTFFWDSKFPNVNILQSELGTLEWWISGLMLDLVFFLISN